jgi:hypothetical protein
MISVIIVTQRRDRDDRRKAAAVLADIGQFVDVFDPAEALKVNASKPGAIGSCQLEAQGQCPRLHFLRIMDVARVDLVHDLAGVIAQHALGADIEQLDDAFLVGGDDRKLGLVRIAFCKAPVLSNTS